METAQPPGEVDPGYFNTNFTSHAHEHRLDEEGLSRITIISGVQIYVFSSTSPHHIVYHAMLAGTNPLVLY